MSTIPSNDGFDEAAFSEEFDRAAEQASLKYGFRRSSADLLINSKRRSSLVAAHAHTAREYVIEVQQWLYDDDPAVVREARSGLRRVHEQIYVGDPDEHVGESGRANLADRLIRHLLGVADLDGPEPWWRRRKQQQAVRGSALLAVILFAAAAAFSIGSHHLVLALLFLGLAGAIDIGEGAFARVVKLRSALLRWGSALLSHFGDLLMIAGICVAQVRFEGGEGSWAIGLALLLSLWGTLVRVSALQAGYRFWVSRPERYIRYCGVIAYCLLAIGGYPVVGAYVCAIGVGIYGVVESIRVPREVLKSPHARTVGIVLMDDDNTLVGCEFLNDTCDTEPQRANGTASKHSCTGSGLRLT